MQTCPGFFLQSLLESPGNLFSYICRRTDHSSFWLCNQPAFHWIICHRHITGLLKNFWHIQHSKLLQKCLNLTFRTISTSGWLISSTTILTALYSKANCVRCSTSPPASARDQPLYIVTAGDLVVQICRRSSSLLATRCPRLWNSAVGTCEASIRFESAVLIRFSLKMMGRFESAVPAHCSS